jgi:hypothetical protein
MTDEEKKELRRARSAFRTAKTYINRYSDLKGLHELKSLIDEKLGDLPIADRKAPVSEQQQLEDVRKRLMEIHKLQMRQNEKIEAAAEGPGIAGAGIFVIVIIAIIFFVKSFF